MAKGIKTIDFIDLGFVPIVVLNVHLNDS